MLQGCKDDENVDNIDDDAAQFSLRDRVYNKHHQHRLNHLQNYMLAKKLTPSVCDFPLLIDKYTFAIFGYFH